jgi:ABC-type sulfate transport system permease subunit
MEILYQDFRFMEPFAAAPLLSLLAVPTHIIKTLLKWRTSIRHH